MNFFNGFRDLKPLQRAKSPELSLTKDSGFATLFSSRDSDLPISGTYDLHVGSRTCGFVVCLGYVGVGNVGPRRVESVSRRRI